MVVDENWKKLFRSLVFMDSWLAYTLGYAPEVTPRDVQVCLNPNNKTLLTVLDCLRVS